MTTFKINAMQIGNDLKINKLEYFYLKIKSFKN